MLPRPLVRHAPAKVNLALHVTGRRGDGYHLLESLAVFTRIGDRLTVSMADEDGFSVNGPFATEVPAGISNLVLRARDYFRDAFPDHAVAPLSIALEKNLPVASGIGGGSSDAAAALHALAAHARIDDSEALEAIGLTLGADLPMCLAARPLIARGIGELLQLVPHFPALPLVLVNPGVAVSTSEIFRRLATRDNPVLPPLPLQLDFTTVCGWLATARNDLQRPATEVAPVIADTLQALEKSGAAFMRMSGSGATCFGLFETNGDAAIAAAEIRARHPGWWVVATESMASEGEPNGKT